MHLNFDQAVALTSFATPAFDVEGEAARLVAARPGFWQSGEPIADRAEGAGIGCRVGSWSAANR